jgi:hypothetical protein
LIATQADREELVVVTFIRYSSSSNNSMNIGLFSSQINRYHRNMNFTFMRTVENLAPGTQNLYIYIVLTDAQGTPFRMKFDHPLSLSISFYERNNTSYVFKTQKLQTLSTSFGVFFFENLKTILYHQERNSTAMVEINTTNIQTPVYLANSTFMFYDDFNYSFIPFIRIFLKFRNC